jgi:hypothetical protein
LSLNIPRFSLRLLLLLLLLLLLPLVCFCAGWCQGSEWHQVQQHSGAG